VWQEWSTNGAISAALPRDFGPGGGDPGERCFTLTRTESGGTLVAVFWGQKGDPGSEGKTEITSRQEIKDIEAGLLSGAEETNIKRIPSYRPVPETKIIEVIDANPYFWNY
jgi:hypothetical protein